MDGAATWKEPVGDVRAQGRDHDPGGEAAVRDGKTRKEKQERYAGKDDAGSVGRRIMGQSGVTGQATATAKVLQYEGGDNDAAGMDRGPVDQDEGTLEVAVEEVI